MSHQKDLLNQAKGNIQKNFPRLQVKSISLVGEGMDSKAFAVNDDFIFRFPKHQEVVDQLKAEISLLPKLRAHVRFEIPNFEYIGQQQENGFPFVGYRKIRGVGLRKDLFRKLDSGLHDKLIKEIAGFIRQIHSFPTDIAEDCGVKVADFKKNYSNDLEDMRKYAYHLLDQGAINYVEELHKGYLSNEKNFNYTPTLLHANLGPDHIIYDKGQKVIAGVIDFGDIKIGDPDYDLMYLYEYYRGNDFIRELLKYYPHNNPEWLLKKLDYFTRCNTIQDVLIGLRRNDDGILQWALRKLKAETKV